MFDRYRQIPEGMQDTLPGENLLKLAIKEKVRHTFSIHGFDEVQTPMLEYMDVFVHGRAGVDIRQMWKTMDRAGNVLVLRPESTTPILRLAATRMQEMPMPMRCCYLQDRLEYSAEEQPLFSQTTQAGVELLGESSVDADAEILSLSIEVLQTVGLEHFLIDIGQVDFFRGLMEEAGLNESQEAQLRTLVEAKNQIGMELFLADLRMPDDARTRLLQLPALYGGEEVLAEARELTRSPRSLAALDRIQAVLTALSDAGHREYVSIDLGMVHSIHYYSGLIFRGLTGDLGRPLLSGGRYDDLPGDFGREMPAIGFAMDVKSLLISLEHQGIRVEQSPEVLLAYAQAARIQALTWARERREAGIRVRLLYGLNREGLAEKKREVGAAEAVFVDETGIFAV